MVNKPTETCPETHQLKKRKTPGKSDFKGKRKREEEDRVLLKTLDNENFKKDNNN